MIPTSLQTNEIESFKMGNSLLKSSYSSPLFGKSFEEILETKAKEIARKVDAKASDVISNTKRAKKKKQNLKNELPNIEKLLNIQNIQGSRGTKNTYLLLEKFKQTKKSWEEETSKGTRHQVLSNQHGFAGQALMQPLYDRGSRKMSKSQMLNVWEKYAPSVTEDITKRSVRIDIPLVKDVQALVLRMHPDRSITASLLASKEVGELIKQNKEKLNQNLKHHHLSLREFNTYQGDLLFDSESGTKKKKRQAKQTKKSVEAALL